MTDGVAGGGRIAAIAVLALAAGCASRCPEPAAASVQAPGSQPRLAFDPAAPLCDGSFAREAQHPTPCRLIGVYALNIHTNKFGEVQDAWPAVFREGVGWVMLESLWYPEKRPSLQTSARYEGKVVEVYGIPRRSPPSPGPQNYVHSPCISPVYEIRVLDGAPAE